jgi:hypothetical protein
VANKIFGALGTNGGSGSYLDDILSTIPILDGDIGIVVDDTEEAYIYRYESSNNNVTNPTSDPQVIVPNDKGEAGSGAWILADISVEDLKVYGNGVIDGTLGVTGNATLSAALAVTGAITGASLKLGGVGATPTEFSTDGTFGGNSDTAIPTEKAIKTYITSILGSITFDLMAGFISRPKFGFSSVTAITMTSGRAHMKAGAQSEGIHFWDSTLTFTFESGGSNAASTDFSGNGSTWFYLYIDESSLSDGGTTELTAANMLANITPPTWDADELGWYNGADRCIGAFYVNSSEELEIFYQHENHIIWDDDVLIKTGHTTSFVAVTSRAPAFATVQKINCTLMSQLATGGSYFWRVGGSSTTDGHYWGKGTQHGGSDDKYVQTISNMNIFIDSSQEFDVKSTSAAAASYIYQNGYYLPEGM